MHSQTEIEFRGDSSRNADATLIRVADWLGAKKREGPADS